MTGVVLSVAGAYGVFLVYTAIACRWTGVGLGPRPTATRRSASAAMAAAGARLGIDDVAPLELAAVLVTMAGVGAAMAWSLFGGVLPPVVVGLFAATFPVAAARARRRRLRAEAADSWPRLIEELRIKTTALGRSLPQALFDVGRSAPEQLRPEFEAARREWLVSTDFERSLAVLKAGLADPTADTVCETLLVAHDIGGNEVDRCLAALIDDRILDQQGRKDAAAHQAGARFARRFVVIVPLGMALVGLSIGEGRAAYGSTAGQALVVAALGLMALCWVWAGHIMRLPPEQRVFAEAAR
ncbi:MAG: hypothetical protein KY450_06180 [Actinobacteria bacterium]|nr:hypothetical protein [Actinomycetota bacterium]